MPVTVKLSGGPASGAIVQVSAQMAERLNLAYLTVTPAGRLYDRLRQRYVHATVIRAPTPRRKRPSPNLELRDTQLPEHRPSRSRPPRATAPVGKKTRKKTT